MVGLRGSARWSVEIGVYGNEYADLEPAKRRSPEVELSAEGIDDIAGDCQPETGTHSGLVEALTRLERIFDVLCVKSGAIVANAQHNRAS